MPYYVETGRQIHSSPPGSLYAAAILVPLKNEQPFLFEWPFYSISSEVSTFCDLVRSVLSAQPRRQHTQSYESHLVPTPSFEFYVMMLSGNIFDNEYSDKQE